MEDPDFAVLVTGAAPGGPAPLKAVRAVTGLSLWHSRRLLDDAPTVAVESVPFDLAGPAARRLREAGVPVAVRCGWCRRTLPEGEAPVDPGGCDPRVEPAAHCPANSLTSCDCDFCAAYGPLPGHGGRPAAEG
ncbi:ribosomal protein L7/L12 [Streptomyces sp. FH025]|uniref:ribosomal protein L7/L12 n=1 Tax=Streptomyces sp. FH025 TaxID=2815937 RepID=UPI001A9E15F1|nr:ribosomal protein L7/L12 [Streptomyces sp. FH025]MBO1418451.1 hypothetical protein [Streptomyces sp. FH025]